MSGDGSPEVGRDGRVEVGVESRRGRDVELLEFATVIEVPPLPTGAWVMAVTCSAQVRLMWGTR